MPVITYQTVEGSLSDDQKSQLTTAITQAVEDVLGEAIKKNAWVIINECPDGNMAIGGRTITAEALKKLMK